VNFDDIYAFIAGEEARLKDKFAENLDGVSLSVTRKGARVWAFGTRGTDRYSYQCGEAATPDEAAERLIAEHFPSPEAKAAKLRDQARELLRAAADLEKEGAK
jgi:hypothetical protein